MGCEFSVGIVGLQTDVVDVPDWTNKKDLKSHLQRSVVVRAIIHEQNIDHLRKILRSRWDVNENDKIPHNWMSYFKTGSLHRSAISEAARKGWTEGLKMLLQANVKYDKPGDLETPLVLAVQNHNCPTELIKLLLKYGADPNGDYGSSEGIPLIQAIPNSRYNDNVIHIVHMLLESGADPNIRCMRGVGGEVCPISILRDEMSHSIYNLTKLAQGPAQYRDVLKTNALLFKILVDFGADVNYNVDKTVPFLHLMADNEGLWPYASTGHQLVLQYHLNFLFLHGGNIYIEYGKHGMALEHAIRKRGRSNYVRWLIRHGADTATLNFAWLKEHFTPNELHHRYSDIALILLQSGMRVSHGTRTQLTDMEMVVSDWLTGGGRRGSDWIQGCVGRGSDIGDIMAVLWWRVHKAEQEAGITLTQLKFRKCIFPEFFSKQMSDLQQFSDRTLEQYPEDDSSAGQDWQKILEQIRTLLDFLNQMQSLQWYCRRCVRENLVSLQPSVVKSLPVPTRLKRYILCHEL